MASQLSTVPKSSRPLRNPGDYSREEIVSDYELAHVLGVSQAWLKKLRVYGGGPKYSKPSAKCVRYKVGDGLDWMTARSAHSTSEMEVAA